MNFDTQTIDRAKRLAAQIDITEKDVSRRDEEILALKNTPPSLVYPALKNKIERLSEERNAVLEAGLEKWLGSIETGLAEIEEETGAEIGRLQAEDKISPSLVELARGRVSYAARRAGSFDDFKREYSSTLDPVLKRAFQVFGGEIAVQKWPSRPDTASWQLELNRAFEANFRSPKTEALESESAGLLEQLRRVHGLARAYERTRPPEVHGGYFDISPRRANWARRAEALQGPYLAAAFAAYLG